ncbi:MAG: HlyD family efflux transporter periplasmic adaptor subunit [Pirellulaceae bacterium]|nr:HlyD family efflux transporter periplasmic adaptor subunit [Pirellulaceae bacterium]
MNYRSSQRAGRAIVTFVVLIGVMVTISATVFFLANRQGHDDANESLLLHRVERSDFEAFVTEPGDVASSSNVEIRCRVKSRGSAGTAILKICEEGTIVKTGDDLIQFDDSVLQNELLAQRIVVANDKALLIQANSDLANAQRTLREFEEGLYQQELEVFESLVFVAEEELRKSELNLASSKRLASRGLIRELQVTAADFAFQKTKKEVAAAERAVDVYRRFTRERMVGEYEAEIEKQEAKGEAASFTLELSQQKLADIEEQITHCHVTAPGDGQVVHANERWRGESTEVIEEGTIIRENQIVIRLPDTRKMQVDVKINESDVNHIKTGQLVEIELDADPDDVLRGELKEIAAYPYPMRWNGAPLEYGAVVTIIDPPAMIKPGLRAKVKIFFESKSNVVQIPLAAVIEHGQQHFCLVREQDGWRTQSLSIGSNNNTQVIIEEGLSEGDQVSLIPFRYIERSDLPEEKPATVAADRNSNKHSIGAAVSGRTAATGPAS